MNLKQKTFLVVAVSIAVLLTIYVAFSNYYVQQQEKVLLDERYNTAQAIGEELTRFFTRGVNRLQTVATLPGLVYGLQSLEEPRQGKQIPAWTTLHYLFYESDVFTDVFLLDTEGKVLWSEPSNQDSLETTYPPFPQIIAKLGEPPAEVAFLTSEDRKSVV